MLVPSRNVIPSWTPRVWARSSRRSQTPRRAQRRKVWAARDHGPSSAGMARHLAPFSCRQTIADSVRRRSFGCVLPLGRHASTNGSKLIQCASDSIALSSFQEGQNARHHNRFKREQALALKEFGEDKFEIVVPSVSVLAEPPVALVDGNVDAKGTRKAAQAYLDFLYTPQAQAIIARNFYRPIKPEAAAKEDLERLGQRKLFTIDEVFGGWDKAQSTHFNDGGVFDAIVKANR